MKGPRIFASRLASLIIFGLVIAALMGGALADAESQPADTSRHLLVVPDTPEAMAALARTDARVVASYESFALVEAAGADDERLRAAGADRRDDMRSVRTAAGTIDPKNERRSLAGKEAPERDEALTLVQFAGPPKDAWLERLRDTGGRIVSYQPENAYVVHAADAEQVERLAALVGGYAPVRAVAVLTAADKLEGGRGATGMYAVQTVAGGAGADARADAAGAGAAVSSAVALGALHTQYLRLSAAEAADLARDPAVVAIEPYAEPGLADERAAQIVAGNLSGFAPSGPGYLDWLIDPARILDGATFDFAIDVTDGGLDDGARPARPLGLPRARLRRQPRGLPAQLLERRRRRCGQGLQRPRHQRRLDRHRLQRRRRRARARGLRQRLQPRARGGAVRAGGRVQDLQLRRRLRRRLDPGDAGRQRLRRQRAHLQQLVGHERPGLLGLLLHPRAAVRRGGARRAHGGRREPELRHGLRRRQRRRRQSRQRRPARPQRGLRDDHGRGHGQERDHGRRGRGRAGERHRRLRRDQRGRRQRARHHRLLEPRTHRRRPAQARPGRPGHAHHGRPAAPRGLHRHRHLHLALRRRLLLADLRQLAGRSAGVGRGGARAPLVQAHAGGRSLAGADQGAAREHRHRPRRRRQRQGRRDLGRAQHRPGLGPGQPGLDLRLHGARVPRPALRRRADRLGPERAAHLPRPGRRQAGEGHARVDRRARAPPPAPPG